MKRFLFAVFMGIFSCMSCYAFTTCVHTNTYMVTLKKNVNGTSKTSDATNKTWRVVFDYITLTGYASCNEISGTANTPKTNLLTGAADTGVYCWCQMWPVEDYGFEVGPSSYWMYLSSYANDGTCASSCTDACATAVKENTTFRSAMFESMW